MKRIIADIHTHTIASGHAYGTIREMAQAAGEKGLEVLGFAEHAPGIPGTVHPFYFLNLEVIPQTLYGVRLIHGSEVNILSDGTLSLEERYLQRLDYAVAGIHLTCYEDAGRERNTANVIACMRHEKVKLISHPDDDATPLDYALLTEAALETGTALEVNNSSLVKNHRKNCVENYRTMLRLCREKGAPVIVSSDAHDPSWVGRFELAETLLEEENFPSELVLNTDRERLLTFLGM
ncbi:MAG: phosphatase [Oscillospiraceae bacterium]|nr:phosphatase [Oscillospiraceae bacterium]